VLFANAGGPPLAGLVVTDSVYAPDLNQSIADWQALVTAARGSGMRNLPDPIVSRGAPLLRPSDGSIDATVPNARRARSSSQKPRPASACPTGRGSSRPAAG
jgi:hypothetical protein